MSGPAGGGNASEKGWNATSEKENGTDKKKVRALEGKRWISWEQKDIKGAHGCEERKGL